MAIALRRCSWEAVGIHSSRYESSPAATVSSAFNRRQLGSSINELHACMSPGFDVCSVGSQRALFVSMDPFGLRSHSCI
jgi:hypothetical protein